MPSKWDTAHKVVLANLSSDHPENLDMLSKRNVNRQSDLGTTPLHFAALSSNSFLVQHLLSKHADINVANYYGESALHWACKAGSSEVVACLLHNGCSPSTVDSDGNGLLHWAAEYDHISVMKLLLDRGCAMDAKNEEDETPLEIASFWGNATTVQFLLEKGANLGSGLLLAMKSDFPAVVDVILQKVSFSKKRKPFPRAPEAGKAFSEQVFDVSKVTELAKLKDESSKNRITRRKRLRTANSQATPLLAQQKKETTKACRLAATEKDFGLHHRKKSNKMTVGSLRASI